MNRSTSHRLDASSLRSAFCTGTKFSSASSRRFFAGVAAALLLLPALAVATPPAGIKSGTVFARASFADATDVQFGTTAVTDARETVTQQIIIAPGGTTGWHSHPGPVVVLIKAGQMSFYDSEDPTCTVRIYSAGQSFVDRGQGHVHIANNEGDVDLELWATYFDVPVGGAFRIDAANPGGCAAQALNISTRGVVRSGDDILIGGFILRGANERRVLVRAIGSSLPFASKLADPSLELFDRNGTSIAFNDNWGDTQRTEISATGIPPTDERESAILRSLTPGLYTAVVRGVNGATGLALVEVYTLQ